MSSRWDQRRLRDALPHLVVGERSDARPTATSASSLGGERHTHLAQRIDHVGAARPGSRPADRPARKPWQTSASPRRWRAVGRLERVGGVVRGTNRGRPRRRPRSRGSGPCDESTSSAVGHRRARRVVRRTHDDGSCAVRDRGRHRRRSCGVAGSGTCTETPPAPTPRSGRPRTTATRRRPRRRDRRWPRAPCRHSSTDPLAVSTCSASTEQCLPSASRSASAASSG